MPFNHGTACQISDEQLERECNDRLSFQNFLGYPDSVPEARTVWLFRERMASTGKEKEFWEVLNLQLREIGIYVREGHPDDAIFVELGGLKPEGSAGKVVEVSKDTAHLRNSTILEADPRSAHSGGRNEEKAEGSRSKEGKSCG